MSDSQIQLRWQSYEQDMRALYGRLRQTEDLTDVVLTNGETTLRCHRVILSAACETFYDLLKGHAAGDVIICLGGVKTVDMRALVEFAYSGEVGVRSSRLSQFLAVARQWGLRGVAGEDHQQPQSGDSAVGSTPCAEPTQSRSDHTSPATEISSCQRGARTEAAQPDRARTEATPLVRTRTEAAQPDRARTEAAQPDRARTEAAQPDRVRTEAAQPDRVRTEATPLVISGRSEAAQPDRANKRGWWDTSSSDEDDVDSRTPKMSNAVLSVLLSSDGGQERRPAAPTETPPRRPPPSSDPSTVSGPTASQTTGTATKTPKSKHLKKRTVASENLPKMYACPGCHRIFIKPHFFKNHKEKEHGDSTPIDRHLVLVAPGPSEASRLVGREVLSIAMPSVRRKKKPPPLGASPPVPAALKAARRAEAEARRAQKRAESQRQAVATADAAAATALAERQAEQDDVVLVVQGSQREQACVEPSRPCDRRSPERRPLSSRPLPALTSGPSCGTSPPTSWRVLSDRPAGPVSVGSAAQQDQKPVGIATHLRFSAEPPTAGADTWSEPRTAGADTRSETRTTGGDARSEPRTAGADTWSEPRTAGGDARSVPRTTGGDARSEPRTAGADTRSETRTAGGDARSKTWTAGGDARSEPRRELGPAHSRPRERELRHHHHPRQFRPDSTYHGWRQQQTSRFSQTRRGGRGWQSRDYRHPTGRDRDRGYIRVRDSLGSFKPTEFK